jgi:hypothetical protein
MTHRVTLIPGDGIGPEVADAVVQIVAALLDKRRRLESMRDELGEAELLRRHPEASGYLRARPGYRLFEQRERLVDALLVDVKNNAEWLRGTLAYPLAMGEAR